MSDTNPAPRIFLSYAVNDGSTAAARLRQRLEAAGLSIWQDIVALEGGKDWWSQIEEALHAPSLEHMVLVVSPEALGRPVVRREIRLAKSLGKQVSPVRSGPEVVLKDLPRWLGHVLDPSIAEHWDRLVLSLKGPSHQSRKPSMAPEPPPEMVARPALFEALKRHLLDYKGDAIANRVALHGAGGFGKTTLARALAHDEDIQDAFFDGVLWVELGESGCTRIITLMADLVTLITGKTPGVHTREALRAILGNALSDRRILFVIDDVWRREDLEPFLHGGTNTARLVTTRFDRALPEDTILQPTDSLSADEAFIVISRGLPIDQVASLGQELTALGARLGLWAQLVKMANGYLRDRVQKGRRPLRAALADISERLSTGGLTALDDTKAKDYGARHGAVATVMNTTLELLSAQQRSRFYELDVFPDSDDIPIDIIAALWIATGQLDRTKTDDLLSELHGISLLLDRDLESGSVRLHDTVREFVRDQSIDGQRSDQHGRLSGILEAIRNGSSRNVQRYFYKYLLWHLKLGGMASKLDEMLVDPGWIRGKIAASGIAPLLEDYELHGHIVAHGEIAAAIRLSAHVLDANIDELPTQLSSRLCDSSSDEVKAFVGRVVAATKRPWLRLITPKLDPPGSPLIFTLSGHSSYINDVKASPDGNILATASADQTIRIWDLASGQPLRVIDVGSWTYELAFWRDSYVVSSSMDRAIRFWDVGTGAIVKTFQMGRTNCAWLHFACSDEILLAEDTDTLRAIRIADGVEIYALREKPSRIAMSPDGQYFAFVWGTEVRARRVHDGAWHTNQFDRESERDRIR